jgi:zinc transport system substrate-binding protein
MRARLAAALLVAGMSAACAPDDGGGGVEVVAGFYPVAWAAEQIGADRVAVTDLTPPGVEPHDLELSTPQVDDLLDADLAVVLGGGFQPAVEDAAEQRDGPTLTLLDRLPRRGLRESDPHVWLDPVLMIETVDAVELALIDADPQGADAYRRRAATTRARLTRLDEAYRTGLADCQRRLLVTAHEAFGYLADRYGLRQEGVAGISPEAEPDPRRLAELADLARDQGVIVIFTEEQLSPEIARTLAREAGGLRTEVLSPLESLTRAERDADADYLSVMERNLDRIKGALGCR